MNRLITAALLLSLVACSSTQASPQAPATSGSGLASQPPSSSSSGTDETPMPSSAMPAPSEQPPVSGQTSGTGTTGTPATSEPALTSGTTPATDSYTVERGDTLSEIGREHGVSYQELARWNNIGNPNMIQPGQTLRLSKPE